MKVSNRSRLVFATLSILLVLIVAAPHAYAQAAATPGDDNQPVPIVAQAPGHFPTYKAVKTSGAKIPAGAARNTGAPTSSAAVAGPLSARLTRMCSAFSGSPSGIAPVAGGQLIEDWATGKLWFYKTSTKSCTLIESPPSGGSGNGYWGLAVRKGLVVAISFDLQGFWTCKWDSTTFTCKSRSAFIYLPSSFCASMPAGYCNPDGIAFDPSNHLWYEDPVNGVEVELPSVATGSGAVGTVFSYGAPVIGIVIDSGNNHWVVDASCSGDVFENGGLVVQTGDDFNAVTISTSNPSHTAHLYGSVANECGNYPYPFVGDISDATILPHPYSSGSDEMPGVSTPLYFTDINFGKVWLTTDQS